MDAEEFRVKVSELEDPKDLTLTELVRNIVVNERLATTYESIKIFAEAVTNRGRDYTAEESCILETAKARLDLLYDELKQRAKRYESS